MSQWGSGAGNYTHKQERGPKPKGARQPVLSLTGFTTGSGVKYGPSFTNGVTVASTMGPAVCTPHKMFGTHTPRPTNIIFNDLCPSSHDSRMFLSLRVDLFIITTVGHKRRVVLWASLKNGCHSLLHNMECCSHCIIYAVQLSGIKQTNRVFSNALSLHSLKIYMEHVVHLSGYTVHCRLVFLCHFTPWDELHHSLSPV